MSDSNGIDCQEEMNGVSCVPVTGDALYMTVEGLTGGRSENYVIIHSDGVRDALADSPEADSPFPGPALIALATRLKAEVAALKAEVAELTRLFGDRVQDCDIAARAVIDERKRLIAAVRTMARILRPVPRQSLEDCANLIADALENLP